MQHRRAGAFFTMCWIVYSLLSSLLRFLPTKKGLIKSELWKNKRPSISRREKNKLRDQFQDGANWINSLRPVFIRIAISRSSHCEKMTPALIPPFHQLDRHKKCSRENVTEWDEKRRAIRGSLQDLLGPLTILRSCAIFPHFLCPYNFLVWVKKRKA